MKIELLDGRVVEWPEGKTEAEMHEDYGLAAEWADNEAKREALAAPKESES